MSSWCTVMTRFSKLRRFFEALLGQISKVAPARIQGGIPEFRLHFRSACAEHPRNLGQCRIYPRGRVRGTDAAAILSLEALAFFLSAFNLSFPFGLYVIAVPLDCVHTLAVPPHLNDPSFWARPWKPVSPWLVETSPFRQVVSGLCASMP
jgi:hypothetical protein